MAPSSILTFRMIFHTPHPITGRSSKFPYLGALLLLLALFSFYGAWSAGRLRAEETSQKNFITIRPEEMTQLGNLHERGDRLMEEKEFRGAIDVYSEILLIEPDDDAAYTNMAQAYLVLGDFKRAGDAFENALHINPDNDIARLGLRRIVDPDFAPGEELRAVPVKVPPKMDTVSLIEKISLPARLPASASAPSIPPKTAVITSVLEPKAPLNKKVVLPSPVSTSVASPIPSTIAVRASVPQPKAPFSEKAVQPTQPYTSDSILDSKLSFNQWSQIALKNTGLYGGAMDGKITDTMKQAVETFQKKNQLEIDGMVGPATWAKLKPYLKK